MKPEHLEDASETTLFDSPIRPVRVIVTAVLRIIQCTFVMVAWMFWAAFGSAFWIALVFRLLAVYTASFLASMFTYQVPTSIEQRLQFVTNLWFDGFRRAYDAVFRPREILRPTHCAISPTCRRGCRIRCVHRRRLPRYMEGRSNPQIPKDQTEIVVPSRPTRRLTTRWSRTWPAQCRGLRAIITLGWPGGSARGR